MGGAFFLVLEAAACTALLRDKGMRRANIYLDVPIYRRYVAFVYNISLLEFHSFLFPLVAAQNNHPYSVSLAKQQIDDIFSVKISLIASLSCLTNPLLIIALHTRSFKPSNHSALQYAGEPHQIKISVQ